MADTIYTTPNGSQVSETELRDHYGDRFDSLVADGTIHSGMLPKLSAAVAAVNNGVKNAHIIDGRIEHALLLEVLTDHGVGTLIQSS